ncbi:hypothetical protein HA402_001179 [Bradysia odoriphaga]|nr:hypothetical protein HA402_001179 [Bradysia odoriphaga]
MFHRKIDFINVDVVYLTYNPQRKASNPSLEYEGNNLAGLPDLHNHYMETLKNRNLMPTISYKQCMWYNSILQEELHEAPSGYKIQVFHWKIESGIHEAFRIKNMEFNTITMIIGANTEYWYGINTSRAAGFRKRGRYPRQFSNTSNILNVRPSLPQCPIILSSCNLTTINVCNCFAKLFLSGQCLTNINCDLTLKKLNELAGIVAKFTGKTDNDTDDDEGVMEDILLFRIYMTKCSIDDALKKIQSNRCKFNFKTKKYSKLTVITESEDEM